MKNSSDGPPEADAPVRVCNGVQGREKDEEEGVAYVSLPGYASF